MRKRLVWCVADNVAPHVGTVTMIIY